MSFLSTQDLRSLFDQLCTEYEYLSENRTKLEADCNKLREYIDAQVSQIKQLNTDFEKLRQEFAQRGAEMPVRQVAPPAAAAPSQQMQQQAQYQEPAQPPPQEEQPEQDWELLTLVSADKIPRPVIIALLAEIVDISVICSTSFSPDGSCLAIGSDKTLRVYNIEKDDFLLQHTIDDTEEEGTTNHVRSISWTADNKKIVCGGEDGHIRVFELPQGEMTQNFEAGTGEVFQVQIANNGSFFAAVTGDGCLSMFSMTDFSKIATMTRQLPENTSVVATSLAISHDDKLVAVGYSDKVVSIWNVENKSSIIEEECHKDGVYAVKLLQKGRLVTASLDSTVKIWDIEEEEGKYRLELWKELSGHTNFVLSLAVDPSGTWLLSGSKDLTARLSNVETGEMIYSIKAHTNSIITVAFNPNGMMFCTGSGDQSVKIWSISPEETEDAA